MELKCTVSDKFEGKTVKHVLKNELKLSERLVKRLKYGGKIFLNSVSVHVNVTVQPGDELDVLIDFEEESEEIIPENISIDIIYEDEYLIALNKSSGIVVHPTGNHSSGTVANGLMYHFLTNNIKRKIRPVSRLDRDTTGIIIFAKNQYVQEYLVRQMSAKTFSKAYLGIVQGIVEPTEGIIDLPIGRNPDSIILRQVTDSGAPSVTHFRVVEYLNNASLVEFRLETGRTHQIRVHCQAIGHPLIGDTLYSNILTSLIDRQALHSYKVCFIHPSSHTPFELSLPLPEDMQRVLEILRK